MFNPEARWDRPYLKQKTNSLDEIIRVCAVFDKGKIEPRFFILKNKLYKVRRINYFWQERNGEVALNIFSVETNSGLYQISFNNKNFLWNLDKIIE
ncbi:MAG: hypothetical protein Q8O13_03125 [Candidatus Omnitrophota bacterium]|nr:hypothetical protein [Candidatus Omnitrophota bacterium]